MRSIKWKAEEVWQRGHHGPSHAAVIRVGGKTYRLLLAAGSDDSALFRNGDEIYAVSTNTRLPYVGLEVFDLARSTPTEIEGTQYLTPTGDVFLRGDQVTEILGPRGVNLIDRTIARRLIEYVG